MTPPLDVDSALLIVTPLLLLEVIWLRMVVRRFLLAAQFAPATR